MVCHHPLDIIFHPRTMVIAGASKNPESQGHLFLRQALDFPFQGSVYPIHMKEQEILGVPCHKSLSDISGPVDHVISCLPHHLVMPLVDECAAKGVRSLHLFTARMAETQLDDRLDLEKEIVRRARDGGMRVIGPNCMGLYCPSSGLTFRNSLPKEPGHVGFASQSGGNAADLEYQGAGRGLRFSKIISFGNAADLNESDFLEYLLEDPQTRVIALYLEGVKEGRRLQELLKRSDGLKPVVLFKAGETSAGTRAVISHTASMSGESALWDALCRQFGIIQVHSMREMADVLLAFQFLPPANGHRVLVMGGGGGGSVEAADALELEGFNIPPLSQELRDEIRSFAPDVWSLISNPMDGSVMGGIETMTRSFQLGSRWDGADLLVGNSAAIWLLDYPEGAKLHGASLQFLVHLAKESQKPMVIFINSGDTTTQWRVDAVLKTRQHCSDAGIPVYPNIQRAARALAHFTRYHRRRANSQNAP